MMPSVPLALLLAACGSAQRIDTVSVAAPGATDVFCDIEHGHFTYAGDEDFAGTDPSSRRFDVGVGVWAEGGKAETKLDSVQWGFQFLSQPGPATHDEGGLLDLWGRSQVGGSGVDFAVLGPPDMDLDLVLFDGWAELYDLRGDALVTADGVFGAGLSGQLDLYARVDGMELDLRPQPGDRIVLQSQGDVVIALPRGTPVDLEVVADPNYGVTVTDLGFDRLEVFTDYVTAFAGEGSVKVEVIVGGGFFVLLEAAPPSDSPPPSIAR